MTSAPTAGATGSRLLKVLLLLAAGLPVGALWFPRHTQVALLLFVLSVAFIYGSTLLWRRFQLDRWLTLGPLSQAAGNAILPPGR